MSWRGQDGKDAPEHISQKLLETAGMDYSVLKPENFDQVLATAMQKINEEKLPYTLIIEKGLFDERH
jgi:hypothetical protein